MLTVLSWCHISCEIRQVYETRLAALLTARNDRTDEHKRAQERYKKVRPRVWRATLFVSQDQKPARLTGGAVAVMTWWVLHA